MINNEFPVNFGKRWDESDKRLLVDMLSEGMDPKMIARKLRRSVGAIQARIQILKAFEDSCGTCVIEQEALNTKAIISIGKILGAEANKVAFKGGELSIERAIRIGKMHLEYKFLTDQAGEVYVQFKGLIPVDPNNPKVKDTEIRMMK